jgi:Na+/melibiose symporter-like transporter
MTSRVYGRYTILMNEKTGLLSSETRQHQLSDPSVDLENETGVPDGSSLDHASTAAEKQQNTTRKITADDVLNFVGFGPFQVIAVFLAGFTYFAYGVDASIFIYIGDNVRAQWNITGTEYAALPASTCFPNVVGAFLFSYLTDRFGRVWPYAICMIWIGVFSIVSAFANSFPLLVVLRCGASLGIGAVAGLTFPTLIEFLPVQNRGKASILNGVIGITGLCVSCGLA